LISTPAGLTRPNARDLSNRIGVQSGSMPDAAQRSDYVWQWGQFLDHDITLTAGGSEPMPIMVGNPADPLFPMIPMNRSGYDHRTGTSKSNPRQQFNEITAFVDGSMIYGSSSARAKALRGTHGRLATSSGGMMLPYNTGRLPNANDGLEPDATLFLAGDIRANEQLGLTSMHTLFLREHNRLAAEVAATNPSWSDEQVYQRTRKLVGAMVQNITYNEYLPALLGNAAPLLAGAAYDSTVDATIMNEFATAAFRLGHTQVSDQLLRIDFAGNPAPGGPVELMDAFFVPSFFSSPVEVDYLLHGLARQVQQTTDVHMIETLRNAMFGPPGAGGLDLLSLNTQRGRDHGLGSLTELQAALELPVAQSFAEITSDLELQEELESIYKDVTDVDPWIGLLAEDRLPGSAVGRTMSHVIAGQFEQLALGDRFFYLWDDELSPEDIDVITGTRLSDIILRNTGVEQLQGNVFFVPEPSGCLLLLSGFLLFRRR
jgi:hypothetical protein